MKQRLLTGRAMSPALVLAGALLATPAFAQFRGLEILRPQQGGGGLGGMFGAQPAAPAQGGDLLSLLRQSVDQIDEPREIEIGRQLGAVLLGSKRLHPDVALQRYVNQVGRWVALQSARPNLPWVFGVLDDPGFNAFAAPGGYVFVTKGLVDRVSDESELAGILAHEIAHVVGKHHLKALRQSASTGLVTQALASQIRNPVAGVVSSQFLSLAKDLYGKGLSRDDELEADRVGVALAARAGFDPFGLVAVLQNLRSAPAGDPLFSLTLATHPPAQLRLDQVEQAMGNRLDAFAGQPRVPVVRRIEQEAQRR